MSERAPDGAGAVEFVFGATVLNIAAPSILSLGDAFYINSTIVSALEEPATLKSGSIVLVESQLSSVSVQASPVPGAGADDIGRLDAHDELQI